MTLQLDLVKETPSGLQFPPHIPQKRGNCRENAIKVTIFFCLSVYWLLKVECWSILSFLNFMVVFACFTTLVCGGSEILNRLCMLCEEYRHILSRYNNSPKQLLWDLFSFNSTHYGLTILSIIYLFITYSCTNQSPFEILFIESNWCWLYIGMNLFKNLLYLEQSPVHTALQIENSGGLDYGSGIAHSFFYGYLRIILPNTGLENDKGLREFQQDYEDRNHISFATYKLFILIPFSQHCPTRLDNSFSSSVSASMELESKQVDRAGVSKRNYKNSVYKIKSSNGKLHYVSAEYATPVKTLAEVMNQNSPCASLCKKQRKELLYNFYTTLLNLIKNDPECKDVCDIIYYDDINQNGGYHDVGGIILKRLREIQKH